MLGGGVNSYISITKTTAMRVIVIDDDQDDRQFLIEALCAVVGRCEILEAPTCMEGLKHLDIRIRERIDYIFLDINMPVTNGKDCLRIIKENRFLKNIAVIMLSTSSLEHDKRDCLSAGAYMYIVKPNSFTQLKESLNFLRFDPQKQLPKPDGTSDRS